MKKFLSVLSVICLLAALVPSVVTAETYENLTYSVSGGKVTITDCAETATGDILIPDEIAGYPVTTVATDAFAGCTGVTSITIGENVISIAPAAFAGCTGLTSITVSSDNTVYTTSGNCLIESSSRTLIAGCKNSVIPTDGAVIAIGNLAFYNCSTLTAITIPNTVTSIGASAFEGCTGLTDVTIGNYVATIGNSAFLGCTALTEVKIPDSVTSMGVYAFSGCTKLADVTIGSGVTTIANATFSGCTELTDVTIGSGVETIDVFAFSGCSKLAKIYIPEGVATIGKFAFYNCGALESAQIPASVTTIGNNAFAGCDKLRLAIDEGNTYAISYAKNNGIPYDAIGLGSLAVTTVTLKPGVAGVYFGSNLDWAANDPTILSYGIAVSTENPLPVADDTDATSLYTVGSTSVLIKDILKTENTNRDNSTNARMKIYARAYCKMANGEYKYSDAVAVTLRQVVIGAQNKWEKLSAAQQEALQQLYNTYEPLMRLWDVPNLKEA